MRFRDIFNLLLNGPPKVTSLMAQTVKHLPTKRETGFDPWVGKIP